MINPLEPSISDLRTSFTRDEIVAKLLGWLRGPIFPMYTMVDGEDFTEEQLIHMPTLEVSLQDHLSQLLEKARRDYLQCAVDDAPYDVADVKEKEFERISLLIQDAYKFISDIDHEISLGNALSALKEDPVASDSETIFYTLKSADEWTQKNFGISIKNYSKPGTESQQEQKVEDDIDVERDGDNEGLSKTRANNLYVTVALLVEAFLEADPNYADRIKSLEALGENWQSASFDKSQKAANISVATLGEDVKSAVTDESNKAVKPVVSNLGKYLSIRSKIPGSRKFAKGQSDEAIMTIVETAIDYKEKVWAARREKLNIRK